MLMQNAAVLMLHGHAVMHSTMARRLAAAAAGAALPGLRA